MLENGQREVLEVGVLGLDAFAHERWDVVVLKLLQQLVGGVLGQSLGGQHESQEATQRCEH
jgi:hypothetical protein